MTPARCVALYREYFKLTGAPRRPFVSEAQPAPEEQKPARLSLSEYLMGRCE
uniref:Uncharacterized protein n=1 Tax=Myoviridae sp. ctKFg29 TaxID=2827675 RepID=A0A8S5RYA0_9CAUD|nr:MAG TPA: hypothetical protein [Myoviridae sp. ctKFg29]